MAPDRRFVVRASRELWVQVERLVRSQRVLSWTIAMSRTAATVASWWRSAPEITSFRTAYTTICVEFVHASHRLWKSPTARVPYTTLLPQGSAGETCGGTDLPTSFKHPGGCLRQGSQECESCQSFLSAALITGGGLGWFLGGDTLRTWMRLSKFGVFAKAQWRKGTEYAMGIYSNRMFSDQVSLLVFCCKWNTFCT